MQPAGPARPRSPAQASRTRLPAAALGGRGQGAGFPTRNRGALAKWPPWAVPAAPGRSRASRLSFPRENCILSASVFLNGPASALARCHGVSWKHPPSSRGLCAGTSKEAPSPPHMQFFQPRPHSRSPVGQLAVGQVTSAGG
ncbi:uncharacterized protein LOC144311575 [Canis aureus]